MYLISKNKYECCGCKACADVCPKQCISFIDLGDGCYPHKDSNICIQCGACERVCPIKVNLVEHVMSNPKPYIGVASGRQIVDSSSSGGAFYNIVSTFPNDTVFYGARFTDDLKVIHDRAATKDAAIAFCKSKYVQSDANNCYKLVTSDLKSHHAVLFTGTPCQCYALLKVCQFKRVPTDRLYLVDILCHGVPSQNLFDNYIQELEKGQCSKITQFEFRNKREIPSTGKINSRSIYVKFEDGTEKIMTVKQSTYLEGYHSRLFYRKSCSVCPFASIKRCTDLTIGDAWGIERINPKYNSDSGCSVLVVNSDKGKSIADKLIDSVAFEMIPADLEWVVSSNDTFRGPTKFHKKSDVFWKLYPKKPFSEAVRIALRRPLYRRIGTILKSILNFNGKK